MFKIHVDSISGYRNHREDTRFKQFAKAVLILALFLGAVALEGYIMQGTI